MPLQANSEIPLPSNRSLFPIDTKAWGRNIAAFSPFNDARLRLVIEGNAALLPPDDPIRHLATLAERPELHPSAWDKSEQDVRESIAMGYVAGVCLGAAIWRDHVNMLGKQGVTVPAAKVETDTTYLAPAPLPARTRIFRKFITPWIDYAALEYEHELHTTLPRYLSSAERDGELFQDETLWMTLLQLLNLNASWQRNGIGFLEDSSFQGEVRDYMRFGMGDVFRLHAILNNQLVERVDNNVEHSSKHHFFPDPKRQSNDLLGSNGQHLCVEIEESDWHDPEQLRADLEAILTNKRYGGYTGLPLDEGRIGGILIRPIVADWNTFVPPSTQIESVYHFDSRYVLSDDGEQLLHLAGDKRTLKNYKLHENDTLILRDKDGTVFTLYYPFETPKAKDQPPDLPFAEVLGLCRLSKYIPLKESATIQDGSDEAIKDVVHRVLEMQKIQRYGRLGRFVAERANMVRLGVPTLLITGVGFPMPTEWVDTPIEFAGLGAAAFITSYTLYNLLGKAADNCLLPRKKITSNPQASA